MERGRAVLLTRHGEQDDRSGGPEATDARPKPPEKIERLKALRQTFGKAPLDEILAGRHEGHKY